MAKHFLNPFESYFLGNKGSSPKWGEGYEYGFIKVEVGPKRSTKRNLKQIITIECTKTVIFQLLRPPDISKLAKRVLIQ